MNEVWRYMNRPTPRDPGSNDEQNEQQHEEEEGPDGVQEEQQQDPTALAPLEDNSMHGLGIKQLKKNSKKRRKRMHLQADKQQLWKKPHMQLGRLGKGKAKRMAAVG